MAWLVILNGNNLTTINDLKELIMSAVQDVIDKVTDQLSKAQGEIVAAIDDLKAQVAAGGQVDTTRLEAAAQALDDVIPDDVPDEG